MVVPIGYLVAQTNRINIGLFGILILGKLVAETRSKGPHRATDIR